MWCVLWCGSGEEEKVLDSCRIHIKREVLNDAFIFTYDRMKRYCGQWHLETIKMFPNYVFLESEQQIGGKDILWNVYPEEEEFLRFLCGKNHHLGMSRGYIRNGVTYVEEGPLRGKEQQIRMIDRHKRIARLAIPVRYHVAGNILAGLEIVDKS